MAELFAELIWPIIRLIFWIMVVIVPLLFSVAWLTWVERKVLAAAQRRQGPDIVGPFGLLQPIADGLKLLVKETILPDRANKTIFILAPLMTFALALTAWAVIPMADGWALADINVGILYLFAVSSLGVYGVIMAGWASNSRYAFMGGLRAAAQMISYEVALGLIIVNVVLVTGTLNLTGIVNGLAEQPIWLRLWLMPLAVVFFISGLAETNRSPFDLPESESELSGGFNVEYSSIPFALFFLGEYANMILIGAMGALLFLGGWQPPFGLDIPPVCWVPGPVWMVGKIAFILFLFIWVRATLPRFRYDQLMQLGWKVFLPLTLVWTLLTAALLLVTNTLPGAAA